MGSIGEQLQGATCPEICDSTEVGAVADNLEGVLLLLEGCVGAVSAALASEVKRNDVTSDVMGRIHRTRMLKEDS